MTGVADATGPAPARGRAVLVPVVAGLGVGVATSFGQAVLDIPWLALVNSASPWLAVAFLAGAYQRGWTTACLAGLAACVLAVVGYYATASLRGFGVSGSYLLLWSGCAVVGGPVFGAAAQAWRRRVVPRGLGGALLPAAFLAEGIGYELALGYTGSAVVFAVVGLVLAAALGRRDPGRTALWLVPATLLGMVGFAALGVLVG